MDRTGRKRCLLRYLERVVFLLPHPLDLLPDPPCSESPFASLSRLTRRMSRSQFPLVWPGRSLSLGTQKQKKPLKRDCPIHAKQIHQNGFHRREEDPQVSVTSRIRESITLYINHSGRNSTRRLLSISRYLHTQCSMSCVI